MVFSLFEPILRVLRGLADPALALFDPSRRVFIPYLLASFVIALAIQLARGRTLRHGFRSLLSRRVWWHRSSRTDVAFLALRGLVRTLTFGAWGISTLAVGGLVAGWLRRHLGDSPVHVGVVTAGACLTLTAFLLDDFTRFAVHYWAHRSPWLWAFHRVHHAAEVLTPLTLYRTHPVEAAINQARAALTLGLVTGVGAWLFGPSLRAWEILGIDALSLGWTLLGANLRHSHVWLSYGPRIERWFLSPAQHQIHHSADPRQFDRNFGEALAIWDRLAGSLYVTHPTPEAIRFGLPPDDPFSGRGAVDLMWRPFAVIARDVAQKATAVSHPTRSTALGFALILAALPAGCNEPSPVDRVAVLQAFGRCAASSAQRFATAAEALAVATEGYAAAPDDGTLARARAAWSAAMDEWEHSEMMRFGPSASPATPGGRGLRDAIYAWPDFNPCLVDQNLVNRTWESGAASLGANARGLATVEYLLFYTDANNQCPPTESINAMGTWAALSPSERTARRAAYARAAAAEVRTQAQALATAWGPTGFGTQLATAGRGSPLFATQQAAVSAVAEGVFHVDTDLKDLRLGRPLGVVNCTTNTCPTASEARWAERGVLLARANLAGARALLEGCTEGGNLGFDDLLNAAGASALTAQMRARLDATDAALRAIPVDGMVAAVASHPTAVRRAYDAARELSSFLKMEFTTALQITGSRVEGDND